MTVSLHAIGTALPPTVLDQDQAVPLFADQPGMTRLGTRLVRSVFPGCGVRSRRTVLPELVHRDGAGRPPEPPDGPSARTSFLDPSTGTLRSPGTGARNAIYSREAPGLFTQAARAALEAAPHLSAQDVTHVVTVSCTGFFAPGPDIHLVTALGLRADVARAHLGFMGCNAAFGGLRTAAAFCRADPEAVVLVVCAELCTLHLHVRSDPDTVRGNALFGDGAAAALLSRRPGPHPLPELVDHETTLAPTGQDQLAWNIGDEGFEMILGAYVPAIIDDHVTDSLRPLLDRAGLRAEDVEHWAVHPGGREILDRVQTRLSLTAEQMEPSRSVLAEVGNLSSATILFVLQRLLRTRGSGTVAAMAFGPGLSIESALLRLPR